MIHNHNLGRTLLTVSLVLSLHLTAKAHDQGDPKARHMYYGQSEQLAGQEVRTYVVLSNDKDERSGRKKPLEVGVEVPFAVMDNLPAEMQMVNFSFPVQARSTSIQFMMMGWVPQGHVPAGVYDKPHFDFHFYLEDIHDVMAIDPGNCSGLDCADYARAVKPVPAQFVPKDYVDQGSVAPRMGNHLEDPTAPEFNGQPFTRTFIYGAYDGEITFFEPMITNTSLVGSPRECTKVKLPQEYSRTAYQPSQYCTEVDQDKKVVRVFLTDFVHRVAPGDINNAQPNTQPNTQQ